MSDQKPQSIETLAVHAGALPERYGRAIVLPVFQTTTYAAQAEQAGYHDVLYARLSNSPNHIALGQTLARLEGTEAGLVAASGMAAITTTLLALLRPGDHLLAQRCLYGATHGFIEHELASLGITHTFVGANDPAEWEREVRPNTKAFYCESLTNPLLEVADLQGIAAFCRSRQLVSLIDNTFVSPAQFRPHEHGFEVVLHSATKYLNGHSDVIAGAVCGAREVVARVKHKLDLFGGSLDAHACFLLQRGIKTLPLRVRQQAGSALELARYFEQHPSVARVHYPGLPSHAQHERAARLFEGFGGMIAVELQGGGQAAQTMLSRLTLAVDAPSLGGPETLVTRPVLTSHAGLSAEQRASVGISDGLIRISVGLENASDLISDFAMALAN